MLCPNDLWRVHARQLRASEHPVEADSSGLERVDFGLTVRKRLNHAAPRTFPKLRVAGSSPVARFERRTGSPAVRSATEDLRGA
jgi:hypothetical protein